MFVGGVEGTWRKRETEKGGDIERGGDREIQRRGDTEREKVL